MSVRARSLPILVVALTLATPAGARPTLDAARLAQLASYEVLVFSDPWQGGLERGKAIGVFDALPEEVSRVAEEYGRYQDFMPRVRRSFVESLEGGHALVDMTADLPWPAGRSKVEVRFFREQRPGGITLIRFQMVRGELRQYLGQIYIEPFDEKRAAVTYELIAEPAMWAPRSTINRSIRKSVSGYVHALRQRVNDLHRAGFLHPLAPAARVMADPALKPRAAKAAPR